MRTSCARWRALAGMFRLHVITILIYNSFRFVNGNYSQYMSARHSLFILLLLLHLALLLAFGNAGGPVALQAPAPLLATLLAPQPLTVSAPPQPPALQRPQPLHASRAPSKPAPRPAVPALAPQRPLAPAEVAATPAPQPETVAPAAAAVPQPSASPAPAAPVQPPRSDAAFLNNRAPAYPALSRRLREQGRVVLNVHVLADGSVDDVKLHLSSGFARLDDAALAAVRGWKFVPARRGDEAVALWHTLPLSFSLDQP